ncbi:hypothetical protein KSE_22490 [Kitasatospora setae KM-6054]|uniref:Uncharacterized protein n=1 Tax=Kitasatospora setae (strain ATCC 33774 / DSM 43861 / JCM 3304 / KCC A-0304 / NBRC 14216 / KM-6054) TaxID=452652 RepID=E4NA38_KITSK|nr:hypothetical protein KSE_22490 [Kitasatospora setae KM-6054]
MPAAVGLAVSWRPAGRFAAAGSRAAARVVRGTAGYLGNTPAVCRASSINPCLFELYDRGRTIADALPDLAPDPAEPGGLPGTGPRTSSVPSSTCSPGREADRQRDRRRRSGTRHRPIEVGGGFTAGRRRRGRSPAVT